MTMISDILLLAGALGAAFYCHVLARRLRRFTDLEQGVGGAIARLSAQVDELKATLGRAQLAAGGAAGQLAERTRRAEAAAQRLELLVASLHDLPDRVEREDPPEPEPKPKPVERPANAFFSRRAEPARVAR